MIKERFDKIWFYIFAIQNVVAYPFPEFQFVYKVIPPNTIDMQTVYNSFHITLIRSSRSAPFEPLSNYFSNKSDHVLIQGLEPCTKYEISTVVYNLQSNVEFTHNENIMIIDNEYLIAIQRTESLSNAIIIELGNTHLQCIAYLYVLLDNSFRQVYTSDNITKRLIVAELEPCTHYRTQILFSHQSNSRLYKIYDQYIKTNAHVAEPPQNLRFDPETNLLSWSPLNCTTNYIITITAFIKSYENVVFTGDTTSNEYDIRFLAKCSQFQISIHPKERDDLCRKIWITTPYEEPGIITNVTVDIIDETRLWIAWNRPRTNPECIKNFVIKINDELQATTNELEHIVDEFQNFVMNNISVCQITQHSIEKCTQVESSEIRNISGINVHSDVTTNRTIISWNETTGTARYIIHYDVTLVDSSEQTNHHIVTSLNRIEIPILTLCESYRLRIKTIPILKQTTTIESTFKFKTEPQKPVAPEEPYLVSKTTSSFTMKSLYTKTNDKCEIVMFRFVCRRGSDIRTIDDEDGYGVISNLKARTKYNCSVKVENVLGWSDASIAKIFETDGEKLRIDLYAHSISSKSIGITWSNHYISVNLTIKKLRNKKTGSVCKFTSYSDAIRKQTSRQKHVFENLEPYTNYSIQLTVFDETASKKIIVTTKPDVPHQVENLRIMKRTTDSVTIRWELPCSTNGRVKGFVIRTEEPYSKSFLSFDSSYVNSTSYNYTVNGITTLVQRTKISVGIKLYSLVGSLNESSIIVNTPLSEWLSDWVQVSIADLIDGYALLNIRNESFGLDNGSLTGFSLVILDRHCHSNIRDDIFPLTVAKLNCIHQCHFSYVPTTVKIIFNEGLSKSCSERLGKIELKRGPDYEILARIFTSKGHSDSSFIVLKSNQILKSSSNFLMIILILLVCLVFIIVTGTALVWYNHYNSQNRNKMNATYIKVESFPDFYKRIDRSFIDNEFKSINDMNLAHLSKTIAEYYPTKNRDSNITPYDYNRVILRPNIHCTADYINASFIDGEKRNDQYIAAQGPNEETVYEFWHMVMEKNCDKIVMLTQLNENDVATKCYKYYPNANEVLAFNDITIVNANEINFSTFIRRQLVVQRGQLKRSVIQYQFVAWPEHECPQNELDVIEFIEFTRNEKPQSTYSMVVHCGAGVARTGTFIALDILLQSFRNDKYISIFDTVRRLRVQRSQMVQTVNQYEFLYSVVNVYFHRRIYK